MQKQLSKISLVKLTGLYIGIIISLLLVPYSFAGPITSTRLSLLASVFLCFIFFISGRTAFKINNLELPFILICYLLFCIFVYSLSTIMNAASGLGVFSWFLYCGLALCVFFLFEKSPSIEYLTISASITLLALTLYVYLPIIEILISTGIGYNFRVDSNQMFQAGLNETSGQFLMASILIRVLAFQTRKVKKICLIISSIIFLIVCLIGVMAFSRQIILLVLLGVIIALIFSNSKDRIRIIFSLFLFLCFAIYFFVKLDLYDEFLRLALKRFSFIVSDIQNTSDVSRLALAGSAIKLSIENPFFGIGVGAFQEYFNKGVESGYIEIFVDIGFIPGIIIFLAYIILIILIFNRSISVFNDASKVSLIYLCLIWFLIPLFNEAFRDPALWGSIITIVGITSYCDIFPKS